MPRPSWRSAIGLRPATWPWRISSWLTARACPSRVVPACALALTAPPEEAVELLERSVTLLAASPARLEHTRALVALGSAFRRVNRRSDAREPLRQALDQAQRGGMRLLADRARHELQAAGARPRRTALTGIDSLTPSERQVADLAAQGHANREIAQRLYVTRRTVETHLTHAYGKLGVSSRSDLVELLTVETAGHGETPSPT
jgi:DNA-binding CsgD family transcriptional regulator